MTECDPRREGDPYRLAEVLRPAQILLIVPPFASLERPSLGVHLLQAIARRAGVECQVLYANLMFAAWFDEASAIALSRTQYSLFLGERTFARAAFGVPPLGYDRGEPIDQIFAKTREDYERGGKPFLLTTANLRQIEARIDAWLESFVPAIVDGNYRMVGCTTSFEQTAASLAILNRVKQRSPQTVTIIGGSNCEGEMADGIAALSEHVDVIFSGESEATFVAFLDELRAGQSAERDGDRGRIRHGEPCENLDELPAPDYDDFYQQAATFLPESRLAESAKLVYESSRGCWWGQKSHCTFCGLNGQGMASRQKSPDRVIDDLQRMLLRHPNREILMADNIMPYDYWKTFVPRLADELPDVRIMYEMKANLTLAQVVALWDAGIREIQPGIESLSTGLLKLMAKGTTCSQNLALLRYSRATGLRMHWNVLAYFPNDEKSFYDEMLELVPLIVHLTPPFRLNHMIVDRFSPYHAYPERHGVTDIRPIPPYRAWVPEGAPAQQIAYHFEATYPTAANDHPALIAELTSAIQTWRDRWVVYKPAELTIRPVGGEYELVDTRGLPGLPEIQIIDEMQATSALVARPLTAAERPGDAWAREHRIVVERDRKLVPLAVANVKVLAEFEERSRTSGELVARSTGNAEWVPVDGLVRRSS